MKSHDDIEKNAESQRRRRSFLATRQGTPPETATMPSPAESEEEDIPVLTEIVQDGTVQDDADEIMAPPISVPPPEPPTVIQDVLPEPEAPPVPMAAPAISAAVSSLFNAKPEDAMATDSILPAAMEMTKAQIEELANEMTQAISRQMAYELPSLIEATLMSVSVELRTGIMATMDAALRDFVANRKK